MLYLEEVICFPPKKTFFIYVLVLNHSYLYHLWNKKCTGKKSGLWMADLHFREDINSLWFDARAQNETFEKGSNALGKIMSESYILIGSGSGAKTIKCLREALAWRCYLHHRRKLFSYLCIGVISMHVRFYILAA